VSDQVIFSWRIHPFRRSVKVSIGVILLLLVIWLVVYLATGSLFFVGIAVVIMLSSLGGFFLPTAYEICADRIRIKYAISSQERELKNYRSFYADKNGVLLSPFVKPSRLENFRGIYLRFDPDSEIRLKVIEYIKSKITASVNSSQ